MSEIAKFIGQRIRNYRTQQNRTTGTRRKERYS